MSSATLSQHDNFLFNLSSSTEKFIAQTILIKTNVNGLIWWSRKTFANFTDLSIRTIQNVYRKLEKAGKIRKTGAYKGKTKRIPVYEVLNTKGERCSNSNPAIDDTITTDQLLYEKENNNKKIKEREPIMPITDDPTNQPQKYQETFYLSEEQNNRIQETHNVSDKKMGDDTFSFFWELYPNKKRQYMARNIWMQKGLYIRSGEIISKLMEQIKHDVLFHKGYIPNAANYLIEERWNDEIDYGKAKPVYDHTDTSWIHHKGLLR